MPLTPKQVAGVAATHERYGPTAAINFALVLCGARKAYRFDEYPDLPRRCSVERARELMPQVLRDFRAFVSKHFGDALRVTDMPGDAEPVVYGRRVTKKDMDSFLSKPDDKAYARLLGYTGTAFPCGDHPQRVHVSVVAVLPRRAMRRAYEFCVHGHEVWATIVAFRELKRAAKGVLGATFGKLRVVDLELVLDGFGGFGTTRDVVVATKTPA